MINDAPFREAIRPEWLDYNGHMNLAYYVLLFDHASDQLFASLGIDETYLQSAGHSVFAAESHIIYESEMHLGDIAEITSFVIAADQKRLHVAHEMRRTTGPARCALQEIMFLSINMTTRRTAPWPSPIATTLQSALSPQPHPASLGRSIGMPRLG
jgi:acyl-CoA thioester hydrolase